MPKLQIGREILKTAAERAVPTDVERGHVEKLLAASNKGPLHVDVSELPIAYLKALLDDSRLTANQRAVIVMQVHGMREVDLRHESIYKTVVSSPVEFGSTFSALGTQAPNAEVFLNGRWYPISLNVCFINNDRKSRHLSKVVILHATLSIGETKFGLSRPVYPELFLDEHGMARELTVSEVLSNFGFRQIRTAAGEFNLKLLRAERMSRERGKVVLVGGPVLVFSQRNWQQTPESRSLGTREAPRKCVIEAELEVSEDQRSYFSPYSGSQETFSRLPFVRVFSLDTKSYVYVDVDDVQEYEFDPHAMSKLHLPPEMLGVLTRIFTTPVESLFGDILKGKHGGIVILAAGNPGVGKTLTAEVYAEQTRRPLYVLELGELGTNVQQLEDNLNRVFDRVSCWNAVLQFDECEIFLARRGDDLERSAIVGSFLRLLDYYHGILFLTTNRPDVLDHAVLSRVMLRLNYPDLDLQAREVVWRTMFESAGMKLTGGSFAQLGEFVLNGRQIRNLTRLAKILHPEGTVTLEQMKDVLRYGCG